jgi:hypothetical protein
MKTKEILFALWLILISCSCHAQSDTSSKITSLNFCIQHKTIPAENSMVSLHDYTCGKLVFPQTGMYRDSLFFRQFIYDQFCNNNCKRYFVYDTRHFVNDPFYPYGNFQSALLCGSLNYLMLLFDQQ